MGGGGNESARSARALANAAATHDPSARVAERRFCGSIAGDCSMRPVAKRPRENEIDAEAAVPEPRRAAPPEARVRASELAEEIRRHERLYHVEGRPEITDAAFDLLMRELSALESEYPELVSPDSPTRRVGGAPAEGFETVEHSQPMLSLENAYDWEEAEAWLARASRILGEEPRGFVAELKIDGLSISLRYEGGGLARGAT